MTSSRVRFSYQFHGHVVAVTDRDDDGRSVTNDARRIIATLATNYDLADYRVICRDTDGVWDEMLVVRGEFYGFRAIGETDLDAALAKIGA